MAVKGFGPRRPALVLCTLVQGCAAANLASDMIGAGHDTYEAIDTASDYSDFADRNGALQAYYKQRAAGDWSGALATIRKQIETPVESGEQRFMAESWNADVRAQGINTLRHYLQEVECNPTFPGLVLIWHDQGIKYAQETAPQTVKQLIIEKEEFEAVYEERCEPIASPSARVTRP